MFTGTQPELFATYNRWMNEKLYAAAAQLSDEQRKADLGAFFKSIHATFEHLLWVDRAWLKRFRQEPVSPPASGLVYPDFETLRGERARCDQEIADWAQGLTPQWLERPFTWKSVLFEKTFTQPGFLVVAQFFNHETHHRGQITTLLTQLGVDFGGTDLPLLPGIES